MLNTPHSNTACPSPSLLSSSISLPRGARSSELADLVAASPASPRTPWEASRAPAAVKAAALYYFIASPPLPSPPLTISLRPHRIRHRTPPPPPLHHPAAPPHQGHAHLSHRRPKLRAHPRLPPSRRRAPGRTHARQRHRRHRAFHVPAARLHRECPGHRGAPRPGSADTVRPRNGVRSRGAGAGAQAGG